MSSRERREIREQVMKVAAMEKQVASLEAKNAELQELVTNIWLGGIFGVGQLEAENTKLRDLVRNLYKFSYEEYPEGTELNFADKLHELGVEVS